MPADSSSCPSSSSSSLNVDEQPIQILPLDFFSTIESADCVETCPFNPSIITCCTYQLITRELTSSTAEQEPSSSSSSSSSSSPPPPPQQQQQHRGSIYHFKIVTTNTTQPPQLSLLQTISSLPYGIFDMKYNSCYPLLAVGQTNRTLSIYRVKGIDYSELEFMCDYQFQEGCGHMMITSVDWSNIPGHCINTLHHRGSGGGSSSDGDDDGDSGDQSSFSQTLPIPSSSSPLLLLLTCGDSSGRVHILQLSYFNSHHHHSSSSSIQIQSYSSSSLNLIHTFSNAHECECWASAFHSFNSQLMYSGGDDSIFKLYDIHNRKCIFKSSNMHSSGICCIQHSPFKEYEFYTGSYDDTLKVWDCRMFSNSNSGSSGSISGSSSISGRFQPIHTFELGGGVWNIKPIPLTHNPLKNPFSFNTSSSNDATFKHNFIATATMYNGFHVLDVSNNSIVAHYIPGEDLLSYGIDWCVPSLSLDDSHKDSNCSSSIMDQQTPPHSKDFTTTTTTNCISEEDSFYLATCTFYDGTLRLTQFKTTSGDL
ncbi:hypothetical protein FDP41_007883 [Naegleria fowleri]|uniref:methylated diphthine methylhydrolase n=1 Tax=Naegleria fowleri TaxID=5763 RepID=A0A6A5CEQ8_NAEFO|nr:uncharacterized protein FDP41_007883 [Naegleria fowleri]KAF0983968.1 hypothetical protein FDP41_007883 [Naegleria fowleri]